MWHKHQSSQSMIGSCKPNPIQVHRHPHQDFLYWLIGCCSSSPPGHVLQPSLLHLHFLHTPAYPNPRLSSPLWINSMYFNKLFDQKKKILLHTADALVLLCCQAPLQAQESSTCVPHAKWFKAVFPLISTINNSPIRSCPISQTPKPSAVTDLIKEFGQNPDPLLFLHVLSLFFL